ncbi:unnamed protein product [Ambrosiozyma monospora]|uniref:Unnamed protein product n=1 Tax=Ambrosiozyma monospora TaxID=43982 RepID=A0ACB5T6Y6_AMBMO|nr:unnamed protein product [Ambrosiozyma monospora]
MLSANLAIIIQKPCFKGKEEAKFIDHIQVKHVLLTFPLRDYTFHNKKVKHLTLIGDSYLGMDLKGLESLESLSFGCHKQMEKPSVSIRNIASPVEKVLIDYYNLLSIPTNIKALDIARVEIDISRERYRTINMLKSVEYLHCKPHHLKLFDYGTLNRVEYLTLYINRFIIEDDDCWKSLPPNVLFINLDVHIKISSTAMVPMRSGLPYEDDGTPETRIGTLYLCFNGEPASFDYDDHLPYFRVEIDTEFAPTFVVEFWPSIFPIPRKYIYNYFSENFVFEYPRQQNFLPITVEPDNNDGFWLDYPSYPSY